MLTPVAAHVPARPAGRGLALGWAVWAHFAALLGLWAVAVPRTAETFSEFGVKLPWPAASVIKVGEFLQTPGGIVCIVGVLVAIAGPLAWLSRRHPALGFVVIGAVVVLIVLVVGSLAFPMVGLVESLQSAGGV